MRFIQDNFLIFISPFIMFFLLRFMFFKFPKSIKTFILILVTSSIILILGATININKSGFYVNALDGRVLLDPIFLHFGNILAVFMAYFNQKLSKK